MNNNKHLEFEKLDKKYKKYIKYRLRDRQTGRPRATNIQTKKQKIKDSDRQRERNIEFEIVYCFR